MEEKHMARKKTLRNRSLEKVLRTGKTIDLDDIGEKDNSIIKQIRFVWVLFL